MNRKAKPSLGKRSNHMQVEYEKKFLSKFDLVKDIPNFEALERFAQKCIDLHCADSLDGLAARVSMDKVIEMFDAEFIAWATKYAQNSMTVKEYNEVHHKKINAALSFVSCLDHAAQKSGAYDEVLHQLRCIGWSEECQDTIKTALEAYEQSLLEQVSISKG